MIHKIVRNQLSPTARTPHALCPEASSSAKPSAQTSLHPLRTRPSGPTSTVLCALSGGLPDDCSNGRDRDEDEKDACRMLLPVRRLKKQGHFISPASLNGETSVPSVMCTRRTEQGSGQSMSAHEPRVPVALFSHPKLVDPRIDALFPPASHVPA